MLKFVTAALALSLALAACNMTEPVVTDNANVRVAHLSPNTPNVDVFLDGRAVLTNVPFKAVSAYLKIPIGPHDIAIFPTGQTTNPAIEVKGIVLEKKNYTIGAIGLLSGAGAQSLRANVYVDDLTINATKARVRVIHASPDAPAVDVGVKGGTPAAAVVKGITFPNATGYLELDAGVLPLEIRAAGASAAVFSFNTPALEVGKVYTVFAVGRLGTAGEFGVVAVGDSLTPSVAVETANVRVAHLSPNTPNVDVFLDGAKVPELTNVPFKTVSGYLKIPVGTRKIEVFATGTTTNPAISVPSLVLEKKNYTVAAVGLLNGTGAQALRANVYVDDLTTNATKARVRVIHASPDAPAVDVGVKGGTPADAVVKGITFPNATAGYLELGAGALALEIRAAGAATAVFSFNTPVLEAGRVYTIFAVGRLGTAGEFGVVAVGDSLTPFVVTETANVRVAHLSPNTPNVDVYLDGVIVPALTNVSFKTVSGYLPVPVGTRKIEVFVAGTTTNPAISVPSLVLEKKNYTVAAIGLLSGTGAQALKANVYVDDLVNKPGKAKVRVIHASPDAPNVDVAVQGGAVVVPNLAYPNATVNPLELDAGTYALEIRAAGSAAAVFKFSTGALAGNQNYTVFAVGRLGTAGEFGVVAKNDVF